MSETPQLWDQLDHESNTQYEAFRCFFSQPRKGRTVVDAYRIYSGNSTAKAATPEFFRWAKQMAWSERARARDTHIDRIHMRGIEKAIEEQAKEEYKSAQEVRGRLHELLTSGYQVALEFFNNIDWSDISARDAVAIIKMHLETAKEFGVPAGEEMRPEDDWDEDDERELSGIMEEVHAEAAERRLAENDSSTEEEGV